MDYTDYVPEISIHAPREGSDQAELEKEEAARKISIHAPREGSDLKMFLMVSVSLYFNPRSP